MPLLSSYNISCLPRSIQPIRGATAAPNPPCIVLRCLHWRCLARVIGVFCSGQASLVIDSDAPLCFGCLGRIKDNSTCLFCSRRLRHNRVELGFHEARRVSFFFFFSSCTGGNNVCFLMKICVTGEREGCPNHFTFREIKFGRVSGTLKTPVNRQEKIPTES